MSPLRGQSYPVLGSHRTLAMACVCVPAVVTCLSVLVVITGTFFLFSLDRTAEERSYSTSGNGIQVAPNTRCLHRSSGRVRLGACCILTSQGLSPISGNSCIIFHELLGAASVCLQACVHIVVSFKHGELGLRSSVWTPCKALMFAMCFLIFIPVSTLTQGLFRCVWFIFHFWCLLAVFLLLISAVCPL